jgi:integrase
VQYRGFGAPEGRERLATGTHQVLFRLLATTGMRLSEAFEIDDEMKERGCRYVIVGKKTEQSERRVPLSAGRSHDASS